MEKIKFIKKPWGHEEWLVVTKKYAFKRIAVKKGHRLSLQYHKKKDETWYVAEGKGLFTLGKKKMIIRRGFVIHIRPKTIHRIEAVTDFVFFEVSTPELGDVVRVEDDYKRK